MDWKSRWPDLILPVGIVACLMVIFVPLPASLMDFFLAANISLAVLILLGTIYIRSPLEFSIFPSLLLAATLGRLALNIGTTRLILTKGASDQENAAGAVIQGFAQFVSGDSLVVGFVLFAIIVVVQFVVITKGATRISEVAARFALDGLPGRQMAIDAELNSGAITAEQAKKLRAETIEHADFYGAMDGASKFVRGDAIAGLAITGINICGGLMIGMSAGMPLGQAANTFTRLTIGDGLASQLPALLISAAAALLVTRSTTKLDLPRESLRQIFGQPVALTVTAFFLGLLILTDLPKIPLAMMACGFLVLAYVARQEEKKQAPVANPNGVPTSSSLPAAPDATLEKLLANEILEMELGRGLIRLADTRQGGGLLAMITNIRKHLASDLGVILPKLRVRDNLNLPDLEFQILLQGNLVKSGKIDPTSFLAVDRGRATGPIPRRAIREMPPEGFMEGPCFWIAPEAYEETVANGYEIFSAEEAIAQQLLHTAEQHASTILTREATNQLIQELQRHSPAVVKELIPDQMSIGQIQRILRGLLDEGVSIRPLELILETLGDHVSSGVSSWQLLEWVRIRLGRHICSRFQDPVVGKIAAYSIESDTQHRILAAVERNQTEIQFNLPRHCLEALTDAIESAALKMSAAGYRPILLVNQELRPIIAELVIQASLNIRVIGSRELNNAPVELLGSISEETLFPSNSAAA
jgi:flagellar biosynthesis protein FlhA